MFELVSFCIFPLATIIYVLQWYRMLKVVVFVGVAAVLLTDSLFSIMVTILFVSAITEIRCETVKIALSRTRNVLD